MSIECSLDIDKITVFQTHKLPKPHDCVVELQRAKTTLNTGNASYRTRIDSKIGMVIIILLGESKKCLPRKATPNE